MAKGDYVYNDNEYLSDKYRKAQAIMGIDVVMREQFWTIGAKAWSEMSNSERLKLIYALRKIWSKIEKEKKDKESK